MFTLEQPRGFCRELTEDFKAAFRTHAAGVAAISADAGSGPVLMTVSSISSVSIDPPLLVFSASDFSSATLTVLAADTMVVHLLTAEHLHLAKLGATTGINRFADESLWGRLPTGEPYFFNAAVWMLVRPVHKLRIGGSNIICAEVLEIQSTNTMRPDHPCSGLPLVYYNRGWYKLTTADLLPAFPEMKEETNETR